jgi:hypothetical protein
VLPGFGVSACALSSGFFGENIRMPPVTAAARHAAAASTRRKFFFFLSATARRTLDFAAETGCSEASPGRAAFNASLEAPADRLTVFVPGLASAHFAQ